MWVILVCNFHTESNERLVLSLCPSISFSVLLILPKPCGNRPYCIRLPSSLLSSWTSLPLAFPKNSANHEPSFRSIGTIGQCQSYQIYVEPGVNWGNFLREVYHVRHFHCKCHCESLSDMTFVWFRAESRLSLIPYVLSCKYLSTCQLISIGIV